MTLIELIVVIAIIGILVGLTSIIVDATKVRGFLTVDISNMKQCATAAAIYASDHDDRYAMSLRPLVTVGLVPKSICLSPLDQYPGGQATRFVEDLRKGNPDVPLPEVPTTYIGPGEGNWSWDFFQQQVEGQSNSGWLVNLVRTKARRGTSVNGGLGPYHRLLMGGSVVSRVMGYSSMWVDGRYESKVVTFRSYFCDEAKP